MSENKKPILFVGAPGSGKSHILRIIADVAQIKYLNASGGAVDWYKIVEDAKSSPVIIDECPLDFLNFLLMFPDLSKVNLILAFQCRVLDVPPSIKASFECVYTTYNIVKIVEECQL